MDYVPFFSHTRPFLEGIDNRFFVIFFFIIVQIILFAAIIYTYFSPDEPTSHFGEPQRKGNTEEICAICQDQLALVSIETNCNHQFCGQCFFCLIDFSREFGPLNCPLCRQKVMNVKMEWPDNLELTEGERKISELAETYNRQFSQSGSWSGYFERIPRLILFLRRQLVTFRGFRCIQNFRLIFHIVVCLFYFLSPLDILPESMFGVIGVVDDLFIFLMLAIRMRLQQDDIVD
ncbi:E3 ubiquitin-protein ligase [Thelohanellus kitauei]|uniref:E3 ubiquitin-protein ligase RNF170 n=1 Tax=Thelohanellus kitauei TaxID=669202 RepID=A0A0C2MQ67_THEKT|nr:E3 ubiquitin-protein ligase [Thelohanellus kitauei]